MLDFFLCFKPLIFNGLLLIHKKIRKNLQKVVDVF